jgi:hypothetical protein
MIISKNVQITQLLYAIGHGSASIDIKLIGKDTCNDVRNECRGVCGVLFSGIDSDCMYAVTRVSILSGMTSEIGQGT